MSNPAAVATRARVAAPARARAAAWRFRGGGTYVYLLPSLVFLVVFTYYPMGFSAYLSLFKWNVLNPSAPPRDSIPSPPRGRGAG